MPMRSGGQAAVPTGSRSRERTHPSSRPLPDALRNHAMDVLLRIRDGADAAIHRHARQAIGVKARDLLLGLQELDHAYGGIVHGVVEVRILDVDHEILRRFAGRPLQVLLAAHILWAEALD